MPALLAAVLVALALMPAAGAFAATPHSPTLGPSNTVIDGPDPAIVGLSGFSVARDGTGGLVYVKDVQGVPHVFVSRLVLGQFGVPQQVDAGLPGPSSQPVIAAASGGLLVIAFINGAQLYAVQAPNALSPLGGLTDLFAGALNPAISISTLGKAYLAFTAVAGASTNVRSAYYNQGQWALEPTPLDVSPGDNAGSGTGRPAVAAAGDGVGIVVWGEAGHVYSRRVWGTGPSIVSEQADVPGLGGWGEISADQPSVSSGGDSSYAAVAFRETLGSGGAVQSRVLMNRLHGSQYDGAFQADGTATPGAEGADQPRVAVTEYGRGFVTSELAQTHDIYAAPLASNESTANTERINSQVIAAAPDAVPATAGLTSTLIAWQQNPGNAGLPEIRLRYAADGFDLDPEQVVSSPSLGPTNADGGLAAAGDLAGDAAVAWVQGSGAGTQIVTAQLYQPPGGFSPSNSFSYATSANPILAWSPSSELWGAVQYQVTLDGVQIAATGSTSVRAPAPVANGRHSWQVTAVNQAGLRTAAAAATVFVDTTRPRVSFTLTGSRTVGTRLRMRLKYTDSPPPLKRSQTSGVKSVQVKWGDGSKPFLHVGRFNTLHTYGRHRTYTVLVIVKDRAGNRTIVKRKLRIKS